MYDAIPTDRDETRLATAIAAGEGYRLDQLEPEVRAHYRKAANSALVFLGMKGVYLNAPGWLADRLEVIVTTMRRAAEAMDADPEKTFAEPMVRAMFASAGQAEAVGFVLRGLPEPEAPASLSEPSNEAAKSDEPEEAV